MGLQAVRATLETVGKMEQTANLHHRHGMEAVTMPIPLMGPMAQMHLTAWREHLGNMAVTDTRGRRASQSTVIFRRVIRTNTRLHPLAALVASVVVGAMVGMGAMEAEGARVAMAWTVDANSGAPAMVARAEEAARVATVAMLVGVAMVVMAERVEQLPLPIVRRGLSINKILRVGWVVSLDPAGRLEQPGKTLLEEKVARPGLHFLAVARLGLTDK